MGTNMSEEEIDNMARATRRTADWRIHGGSTWKFVEGFKVRGTPTADISERNITLVVTIFAPGDGEDEIMLEESTILPSNPILAPQSDAWWALVQRETLVEACRYFAHLTQKFIEELASP